MHPRTPLCGTNLRRHPLDATDSCHTMEKHLSLDWWIGSVFHLPSHDSSPLTHTHSTPWRKDPANAPQTMCRALIDESKAFGNTRASMYGSMCRHTSHLRRDPSQLSPSSCDWVKRLCANRSVPSSSYIHASIPFLLVALRAMRSISSSISRCSWLCVQLALCVRIARLW